jgi:tRNA dimethylallyltransferase
MPTNRELLHQRINQRFDSMLEMGIIDEVANLRLQYPELTDRHNSMRTVGYSQVWSYLEGVIDYESLRMEGMAATRQLAKRQLTWLRSLPLQVIDDPQLNQEILLQKTLDLISTWIY